MTERFTQRTSLAASYRPLIVSSIVLVALITLVVGAVVGMTNPDSPMPVRWLVGLAVALLICGLVLLLRTRILKREAGYGSLEVDERGLVARYGGTVRTLEWGQVERLERLRKPVKGAAKTDTAGGAMVIGAVNAATRATAPKSLGVIGVGSWTEGADANSVGRELAVLSTREFGAAPCGGVVVPIWFDDYGPGAERQLTELVRRHRPDLAGVEST
ncbi:hypothetical protein EK0264_11550 [Epidermidibacterium keratini]|uniref:Uncharacterized protein n=1 Tax=Epidermidibacterium keratini TaxID=1891644 RepID=A0A7L4YNK8_9ACTN|nr:hypothetical protein [Epidermidibacterium keratini]QHC00855.1 hypothetical protein EK0264_11550 [Epidermidibacterium keratini]